ncbi:hypothetical protein GGF32_006142, partial [Allomyces javanicus]
MSTTTKQIGRYSFKCTEGCAINLTRSWMPPFQKTQFEGKPITVTTLVRPALLRLSTSKHARSKLVEVGVYLWTNGGHFDGRVIDVVGRLSFQSSAEETRMMASYEFSYQFLGCRVSKSIVAVTMIEIDFPASGLAEDAVVDLTLSYQPGQEASSRGPVVVPASLGLARFLHNPDVSDCSFSVGGTATPLHASRILLMRASRFFYRMFSGPWAEAAAARTEHISFTTWSAPAVALAFLHIYSGWTPSQPSLPAHTPAALMTDFACNPGTLSFATWRQLGDLAQFLELKDLALAVNGKQIALLQEQTRELAAMPDVHSDDDDDARPRKRKRGNS